MKLPKELRHLRPWKDWADYEAVVRDCAQLCREKILYDRHGYPSGGSSIAQDCADDILARYGLKEKK